MTAKPVVDDKWRIPDELWARIEPLLPPPKSYPKGGRPPMSDRPALDALYYVLRTGCQWKALPRSLGAASTVHDRSRSGAGRGCSSGSGRRAWPSTTSKWGSSGNGRPWTA